MSLYSIYFGIFFLFFSLLVIYIRGYLIPGTPLLTKKYFPEKLLSLFNKNNVKKYGSKENPVKKGKNIEKVLKNIDVVKECEKINDICLTESFRQAWKAHIKKIRNSTEAQKKELASMFNIRKEKISFKSEKNSFILYFNGKLIAQWESQDALIADIAARKEIEVLYKDWRNLEIQKKK